MALPNLGFLARIRAQEIEAKAAHDVDDAEAQARALDADEVANRADRRAAAKTEAARGAHGQPDVPTDPR
jgi:hypothetical protein